MRQATCKIASCGRGGKITRGYCNGHYMRVRRSGDPQEDRPLGESKPNLYRKRDDATGELVVTRPSTGEEIVFLFDAADYDLIRARRWCVNYGYAVSTARRSPVRLHRLLLGAGEYDGTNPVDHINGDIRDNRRANLQLATPELNGSNRAIKNDHGSSQYRGVSYEPKQGTWYAYQTIHRRMIALGRYPSEDEAAAAVAAFRARHDLPAGHEAPAQARRPPRRAA